MRINKEELKHLAEKSDTELWKSITEMAERRGYKLPSETPKKTELEKLRRALLGIEKISLTDAAKIINSYKKQK